MGFQIPLCDGQTLSADGCLEEQEQSTPDQVHFSCRKLCWKATKSLRFTYLGITCVALRTFWTLVVTGNLLCAVDVDWR